LTAPLIGAGPPGPLAGFYRVPRLRAAVCTEVNPSYEPSGAALARYVDVVAGSLAAALTAAPV